MNSYWTIVSAVCFAWLTFYLTYTAIQNNDDVPILKVEPTYEVGADVVTVPNNEHKVIFYMDGKPLTCISRREKMSCNWDAYNEAKSVCESESLKRRSVVIDGKSTVFPPIQGEC